MFNIFNVSKEDKRKRRKRRVVDFITILFVCAVLLHFNSTNLNKDGADKEIILDEVEEAFYQKVQGEKKISKDANVISRNPKLLKIYSTLSNISYSGGANVPTLYKYTKYENATNYIHTKEDNIAGTTSTVVKIYYDRLSQSDIDTYTNAIEKYEKYKKVESPEDKVVYIKPDSQNRYYTYVIIESDSITYGVNSGEYYN